MQKFEIQKPLICAQLVPQTTRMCPLRMMQFHISKQRHSVRRIVNAKSWVASRSTEQCSSPMCLSVYVLLVEPVSTRSLLSVAAPRGYIESNISLGMREASCSTKYGSQLRRRHNSQWSAVSSGCSWKVCGYSCYVGELDCAPSTSTTTNTKKERNDDDAAFRKVGPMKVKTI